MKTIFGILVLAFALLTGVLYYRLRTAEQKTSDWQQVQEVPTKIWNALKSIGHRFTNVFTASSEPAPAERLG
jgi:CHASE3 domain sensor protein